MRVTVLAISGAREAPIEFALRLLLLLGAVAVAAATWTPSVGACDRPLGMSSTAEAAM
jgi:hypothetical protein